MSAKIANSPPWFFVTMYILGQGSGEVKAKYEKRDTPTINKFIVVIMFIDLQ